MKDIPTMPYSGLTLDRVSGKRGDPETLTALRAQPASRVIPLWRDNCLVRGGAPVILPAADGLGLTADAVLLGVEDAAGMFAVDLSAMEQAAALEVCGADALADVRSLVSSLTAQTAGALAYARGILHWHCNQRFCGACGGATRVREAGHLRVCDDCDKLLFPRIEPAVLVLVELPGSPRRCLLGRHHGAAEDNYGTLAGFVEIGESLEDAVRREVAEEAGVAVGAVEYLASQAWPFPAGLMAGFHATAVSDRIDVDGAELLDARWFTADELRARLARSAASGLYREDSIGRYVVERWLAAGARS